MVETLPLVERLRELAEGVADSPLWTYYEPLNEAADLIESQAERIAELEKRSWLQIETALEHAARLAGMEEAAKIVEGTAQDTPCLWSDVIAVAAEAIRQAATEPRTAPSSVQTTDTSEGHEASPRPQERPE